nr:hypothetical protein Iba_chr12fCG11780 [Ipomoea batatas]
MYAVDREGCHDFGITRDPFTKAKIVCTYTPAGEGWEETRRRRRRERRTVTRLASTAGDSPPTPLTRHRRCLASAAAAYPTSLPRLRHDSLPIVVPLAVCSL